MLDIGKESYREIKRVAWNREEWRIYGLLNKKVQATISLIISL